MSYIALYRKYRPLTFDEVVGQNHITDILRKQIVNDKISHAYIFSGSRGTGKTSTAKIFSRAVNCLQPKDGNPCNECSACKSILEDETTDVIEMDAASNNSVENIRAIRQEVIYATTSLKYKIYIIDEAHMLSTSAFNALLKTLEEPPENVIFILATTEEHKLLPTILSRCMRFEFKKISIEYVIGRIEYILKDSNIEYDKEAISYVASICDGGMRDALSILERCIDDQNSKITLEKIQDIVGMSDMNILNELADGILEYNLQKANESTQKILDTGKDVRYITSELLNIFMNAMLNNAGNESKNTIRFNYIIKELSKLDADLRQAINVNILFKAKIIELCTKVIYEDKADLLEKIEKLEMRIKSLEDNKGNVVYKEVQVAAASGKDSQTTVNSIPRETKQTQKDDKPKANKIAGGTNILFKDFDKLRNIVMEKDNLQLYSALTGVKAFVNDDEVIFNTENKFAYTILSKNENAELLREITHDIVDPDCTIKIQYDNKESKAQNNFESYMQNNDIPFTTID